MNKTDEGGEKIELQPYRTGSSLQEQRCWLPVLFPEKKEEECSKYGCLVYFMFSPHFFSWESIEAPVPPFWPIGKESREEIFREKIKPPSTSQIRPPPLPSCFGFLSSPPSPSPSPQTPKQINSPAEKRVGGAGGGGNNGRANDGFIAG